MQIPIYVINLDRRPDRMRSIAGQLDRLGLEATRVPAVDARNLTDDELRARADPDAGHRLRALDRAEVACTLSHLRAMEMFLAAAPAPAALILEDDAELAPDTPSLMQSTDWWPAGSKVIRLEDGRRHRRLLRRVCGKTPGAGGTPHHL